MILKRFACSLSLLALPFAAEAQSLASQTTWVNDHAKLVNEEVLAQRDLLATILQANMAVITVEQNDVVRKISGWAAIIAVPTFIASLYGMNFEHMPETDWEYGYLAAIALMVAIGAGLYAFLRRIDWL